MIVVEMLRAMALILVAGVAFVLAIYSFNCPRGSLQRAIAPFLLISALVAAYALFATVVGVPGIHPQLNGLFIVVALACAYVWLAVAIVDWRSLHLG